MKEQLFNNNKNKWLAIDSSDETELQAHFNEHQIDVEVIDYALDKNERAHLSYDKVTNVFVLIYNVAKAAKIDNHFETIPVTFIVKKGLIMTVTSEGSQYVTVEMTKYLEKNNDVSCLELLFSSLFIVSEQFFPYLDEMSKEIKQVSNKLSVKTTKKSLLQLSDLEMGILLYVSATRQNAVVLEQIKLHTIFKQLNDSEKEELDDALIEAKQLVEMTQLSSNMLQQLSGTYNNILNNNLNETMRILTVLSILLTIPTIITGFFGMNMPLPLEHNVFGWLITIILSLILWFGLSLVLRKIMR